MPLSKPVFVLILGLQKEQSKTKNLFLNCSTTVEFNIEECADAETAQQLIKERGNYPTIIVFPPQKNILGIAQLLRKFAPLAHYLFFDCNDCPIDIKIPSVITNIGKYWELIDPNNKNIYDKLNQIVESTRKRYQYRTTITKIQNKLNQARSPEVSALSRYTVSVRFLADIMNYAHDAIIAITTEGVVVNWNIAAENIFSLTKDVIVGRVFWNFIDGEIASLLPKILNTMKSYDIPHSENEFIFINPTRKEYILNIMISVIQETQGDTIGFSFLIRDVTKRRHLEEKIHTSKKMECLGILASGIAHHFNNLLTAVIGHANLAKEFGANDKICAQLNQLTNAAERAASLSHQMLLFSGKGNFDIKEINIHELVNNFLKPFYDDLGQHISITESHTDNDLMIPMDLEKCALMLANIMENAVESIGDKPGAISIKTKKLYCSKEILETYHSNHEHEPADFALIEIADTGVGLDQNKLRKIFDPFYSTKFTGRGLGLAIAKSILDGHQGLIKVSSELGKGTRFQILLPLCLD